MVEDPNKLLDRARRELHTYDRVGKQTSSELILALFEAERQIAELRAELDAKDKAERLVGAALRERYNAVEAHNARLSEALTKIASCTSHHPDDVVAIARAARRFYEKHKGGEQ
jgi:hypothetical protein